MKDNVILILSPVLMFAKYVQRFGSESSRIVITFLYVIYGITFVHIGNSDYERYIYFYQNYTNNTLKDLIQDISNVITGISQHPDIAIYIISYLGNLISEDPIVFRIMSGLLYGYFFIGCIHIIYRRIQFNGLMSKILFWSLVFTLNISAGLNGVRWPLAFMIYAYFNLKYAFSGDKKYLLLLILSPLTHFSFWILYLVQLFVLMIPKMVIGNMAGVLVIGSLLIGYSGITTNVFQELAIENTSGVANEKVVDYTGDGYIEKRQRRSANWNWYVSISRYGPYILCIILYIFYLVKSRMQLIKRGDSYVSKLELITLSVVIVSLMVGSFVDLATNRYAYLACFFVIILLLYSRVYLTIFKIFPIRITALFIFVLKILITVRVDLYTFSPYLIFWPLYLIDPSNEVNIYNFLSV